MNKQGEAALLVAEGQKEKLVAEACDIRNDCHAPQGSIPVSENMVYGVVGIFSIVITLGISSLLRRVR